jgi:hypothetical protein
MTLGLADLALLEPVGDVVQHGQVREQRVLLEDGVDVTPVRGRAHRVGSADQDLALVRLLEAGDQPQRRGLAAARRPQERQELALADLQVDGVDCRESAEALRHGTQLHVAGSVAARRNCAHVTPPDEC